jgi:hypothetical protein
MKILKRARRIVLVTAAAALTIAIGTLKAQETSSGEEEAGLLKTYEYKGPDRYICWMVNCSGTQCCYMNEAN